MLHLPLMHRIVPHGVLHCLQCVIGLATTPVGEVNVKLVGLIANAIDNVIGQAKRLIWTEC